MSLRVIDTSSYQASLNLLNVDYDAVMVKATEGLNYVNPYCDTHMQEAIAQGKPNGVYHFARVENDPREEARFFVANVKGYLDGTTMLALDFETNDNMDWATAWHDEVFQLTGVYALHYGSESVYRRGDWSSIYQNHGLWVARYADMEPDDNWDMTNAGQMPDVNWNPQAPYVMWQWTSVGHLNGYGGNLDQSIFYGDKDIWLAYCKPVGSTPAPQPIPEPTPQPVPDPVVTPPVEEVPIETPTTPIPVVETPVVLPPVVVPVDPPKRTSPLIKAILEYLRVIVFSLPAVIIQILTNDPALAFTFGTPILAILKAMDKYIHDNPNIKLNGLLPF